jgi:hypothetical protein
MKKLVRISRASISLRRRGTAVTGPYCWWVMIEGRRAYFSSTARTAASASMSNVTASAARFPSGHGNISGGLCGEQAHELVHDRGRRQRREIGVVVGRRDLDDVGGDEA